MEIPTWVLFIIGLYFLFNFIWSIYLYFEYLKYVNEKLVFDEKSQKCVNLHDLYPDFRRYDNITYFRFLFGVTFLFWIKLAISVGLIITLFLCLKVINFFGNDKVGVTKRFFIYILCKIHIYGYHFFLGINTDVKKSPKEKEVYEKYLGPNYDVECDRKYSLLISNHTSWNDILIYVNLKVPAFIAKKDVESYPVIGLVAKLIGSLFVDRDNQSDRKLVFEAIKNRQIDYMNGESQTPLILFPEGTTSSGRHLIKFKRGAFDSLLPIKPFVIKNLNKNFDTSTGSISLGLHFLLFLCHFYHKVEVYDLPVIEPTEFMYENFPDKQTTDKVEIFMETTRFIMSELGDLKLSNSTIKDNFEHYNRIQNIKRKVEKKD